MGLLKKFQSTVSDTKSPDDVRLTNPNPRSVKLQPADPEPVAPAPEPEVTTVVNTPPGDDFQSMMEELGLADLLEPEPEPEPVAITATEAEPEPPEPEIVQPAPAPAAPAPETPKVWQFKPPRIDEAQLAEVADLRNFAVLVTLRTSRWNAKVSDRKALNDVATANSAKSNIGQFQKNLLAGADAKLKAVNSAIDAARHTYYRMTLPWTLSGIDAPGRRQGSRLLPNDIFFEFTKTMVDAKKQMQDRLKEFTDEYPKLIQEAQKSLGDLFNAKEYPSVNAITSHFDLAFEFAPIPQGNDFAGLPKTVLDKLSAKVNEQIKTMTQNAMDEAWTQLYDTTKHLAERLSDPDKIFHASSLERASDMVKTLKALNIAKDANLEGFRHKLETEVLVHEPKKLREDTAVRAKAAAHARGILNGMQKLCS